VRATTGVYFLLRRAVGGEDLVDEEGTIDDAAVGDRHKQRGLLEEGGQVVALADGGDDRFAGVPGFAVGGPFPFLGGNEAVRFARQADAGRFTEAEGQGVSGKRVGAQTVAEFVEGGVAGHGDGAFEV
jgi:hypothetical protein